MPHLPQPARARAMAFNRVIRRASKSPQPDVDVSDIEAAGHDTVSAPDAEMRASPDTEN